MRKSSKLALVALLFVVLFLTVMLNIPYFSSVDSSVNSWSSGLNSNFGEFSKAVGYIFDPTYVMIYIVLISLMLFFRKERADSIFFVLSGILGGGLIYVVKEIVQRARPLDSLVSESSFSFPSGHATMAVILFGYLAYLQIKKIKKNEIKILYTSLSVLCMLIIGFSRLVLNVHYFSDVLAGFLLGGFVLFAMLALRSMIKR